MDWKTLKMVPMVSFRYKVGFYVFECCFILLLYPKLLVYFYKKICFLLFTLNLYLSHTKKTPTPFQPPLWSS